MSGMSAECYGTIVVNLQEYLWLVWFAHAADFGPAHEDVYNNLIEQYETETGNTVPEGWKGE